MKSNQSAVKSTALPLVEVRNNQTVITSLQLATDFNKQHKDVLRDIKKLECSTEFQERNFALSFYISKLHNNGHKRNPMYYITRDGFIFLAMGFTGKEASKFKEDYITAFNAMEQKLREIEQKGLVSVKLLAEQKKLTKYWQNAHIDLSLNMTKFTSSFEEYIAKITPKPSTLRPKKMYQLTDEYYNSIVDSVSRWIQAENVGEYGAIYRDQRLVKRLEAIRLTFHDKRRNAPGFVGFNFTSGL